MSAAALLAAAWLAAWAPAASGRPAAAGSISLAEYRQGLKSIQDDLGRGDWQAARLRARRLADQRIVAGGEALAPDRSVLRPLATAGDRAAAGRAALRLAPLLRSLPGTPAPGSGEPEPSFTVAGSGPTNPRGDPALLERLRRRQALPVIAAGGRLPDPGLRGGGLLDALRDFLRPAGRTLASLWEGCKRWLERWLASLLGASRVHRPAFGLRSVVLLAVLLALAMAWLAVQAARRRRRQAAAVPTAVAPVATARDDDPLSRASGQWEAYARELAEHGRYREAIRAWFHAVLVVLYQGGILHYRQGRTNWEYLATVPPTFAWRPVLVEMTRRFEREWYGRDRSSLEALAASQDLARRLLESLRSAAV